MTIEPHAPILLRDLGRMAYETAFERQHQTHAEVLQWRAQPHQRSVGVLLLLEHDPPVITISRRPDARKHLLAPPETLARAGVQVCETDRGGDITYHGPGQLVAYPIIDLNRLNWTLHHYVRTLEAVVMAVCSRFDLPSHRDHCATGVWVGSDASAPCATDAIPTGSCAAGPSAKICAIGVRVRRWITMHGLALNVTTNLDHFNLIVPCGLAGREVTSLQRRLGDRAPDIAAVKHALAEEFASVVNAAAAGMAAS